MIVQLHSLMFQTSNNTTLLRYFTLMWNLVGPVYTMKKARNNVSSYFNKSSPSTIDFLYPPINL